MTFPSPQSAIEYVKSKLRDFYAQSAVFRQQLQTIGRLKQEAQKRNDQESLGKLIVAQEQTKALWQEQLALEDRLKPFADYFGIATLGVLPVFLVGAALGTATLLYLHFEKIKTQQRSLELIAQGMMTPAEADKILNPGLLSGLVGTGIGGIVLPLGIVFGLYLFLTRRTA